MGKIEIDNVKMLESILGFEAEVKTEDLMNNPTSVAIKFINDAIKKALEDQGLEYKDGSLHYIGEEEKKPATIEFNEEYDEVVLRDGDNKGITLQVMAEGRNISDFRISKQQAEVLVRNMQKWLSKCPYILNEPIKEPIAKSIKNELPVYDGEVNIDFFVSAYMKRHHRMQYRGEIGAYREGLLDMWNKLKKG